MLLAVPDFVEAWIVAKQQSNLRHARGGPIDTVSCTTRATPIRYSGRCWFDARGDGIMVNPEEGGEAFTDLAVDGLIAWVVFTAPERQFDAHAAALALGASMAAPAGTTPLVVPVTRLLEPRERLVDGFWITRSGYHKDGEAVWFTPFDQGMAPESIARMPRRYTWEEAACLVTTDLVGPLCDTGEISFPFLR